MSRLVRALSKQSTEAAEASQGYLCSSESSSTKPGAPRVGTLEDSGRSLQDRQGLQPRAGPQHPRPMGPWVRALGKPGRGLEWREVQGGWRQGLVSVWVVADRVWTYSPEGGLSLLMSGL